LIRADRLSGGKNNRRHCIVLVSIHFSSPESPSEFFGVEAAPDFVFLIAGRQPGCFVMPPLPFPKKYKGFSIEKK